MSLSSTRAPRQVPGGQFQLSSRPPDYYALTGRQPRPD